MQNAKDKFVNLQKVNSTPSFARKQSRPKNLIKFKLVESTKQAKCFLQSKNVSLNLRKSKFKRFYSLKRQEILRSLRSLRMTALHRLFRILRFYSLACNLRTHRTPYAFYFSFSTQIFFPLEKVISSLLAESSLNLTRMVFVPLLVTSAFLPAYRTLNEPMRSLQLRGFKKMV